MPLTVATGQRPTGAAGGEECHEFPSSPLHIPVGRLALLELIGHGFVDTCLQQLQLDCFHLFIVRVLQLQDKTVIMDASVSAFTIPLPR